MCPNVRQGGWATTTLAYPWWMWVQWKVGEGDMGCPVPLQILWHINWCVHHVSEVARCKSEEGSAQVWVGNSNTVPAPMYTAPIAGMVHTIPICLWCCQTTAGFMEPAVSFIIPMLSRGDFVAHPYLHHCAPLPSKPMGGDFFTHHHPICSPNKHKWSSQPTPKWVGVSPLPILHSPIDC